MVQVPGRACGKHSNNKCCLLREENNSQQSSQFMAGEGRRLKWINNKDFLSISSRIDAGEQRKDAENSLQSDDISSPSRALGAGRVGSTGRKGMDHTSTWGIRSCWRDSVHHNRSDQLGSITCVPWDVISPMFSFIAFSHPSASGRVIPWRVLLLRAGHRAARSSPSQKGEGDKGRLQLIHLCLDS